MSKNSIKRFANQGMSTKMYEYIMKNKKRLKSVDTETGVVETAKGTNGYKCSSTGYLRVKLGKKTVQVHSILAVIIYGKKAIGKQVNHINGIKTDNSEVNLEVVTQKENLAHQWATGLSNPSKGSRNPNAKLTEKQVREIREFYTPGKKRGKGTPKNLSVEYGVAPQTIHAIVSRERYKNVT